MLYNQIESFKIRIKIISDKLTGVDFIRPIQPEEIGYDSSVIHRSSPSCDESLRKLLKNLPISDNDSIIDIGSGKGQAIRTMCQFDFKKIDGIEISKDISEISKNNFLKLKENRVTIYNCDALDFSLYGNYNFFYFYNPFPAITMKEIIEKLCFIAKNQEKEIIIIYNHPLFHDEVISSGVFLKVAEYPERWDHRIYLYSNKPKEHSRIVNIS